MRFMHYEVRGNLNVPPGRSRKLGAEGLIFGAGWMGGGGGEKYSIAHDVSSGK